MGFFDDIGDVASSLPSVNPTPLGQFAAAVGGDLFGGGSTSAPGLSAEEQAMLQQLNPFILQQIQQQEGLFQQLMDVIAQDPAVLDLPEMAGLREVFDLRQQRQVAALEGDFELDPYTARSIAEATRIGEEELSRQLGSDFLKSTAGGQGFSRLLESEAIAKNQALQAELASGNQALLGLTGGMSQLRGLSLAQKGQQLGALGSLYNPAAVTQQALATLDPSQAQRLLEFQTQLFNQQSQNQLLSDLFGLGGTLGGAYLGGPVGALAGSQVGSQLGNVFAPQGLNFSQPQTTGLNLGKATIQS